jgi:hypothetical protein
MPHPSSIVKRLRRRPSPAMVVAVTALFLSLGGASYAAVALPSNSIGSAQLKNQAVTFTKINPGAVGTVRINSSQVQRRVAGTCTSAGQAITSVGVAGQVTCGAGLPSEYDSGVGSSVPLTSATTPATVASYALPGGTPYLVQADPYIKVTPDPSGSGAEWVTVACTLAAGPATTAVQTRNVVVDVVGGTSNIVYTSIPLTVTAPLSANSITADVTCTQSSSSGSPTVAAQTTIYAVPTASNTTVTTGTTTTAG